MVEKRCLACVVDRPGAGSWDGAMHVLMRLGRVRESCCEFQRGDSRRPTTHYCTCMSVNFDVCNLLTFA